MTTQGLWYAVSLSLFVLLTVLVWGLVIQRIAERLRLRAARRRVSAAAVANAHMALPSVPARRLHDVGGWVQVGGRKVHRCCAEDRRDGRYDSVCRVCADRLGMAPTGGAA